MSIPLLPVPRDVAHVAYSTPAPRGTFVELYDLAGGVGTHIFRVSRFVMLKRVHESDAWWARSQWNVYDVEFGMTFFHLIGRSSVVTPSHPRFKGLLSVIDTKAVEDAVRQGYGRG